MSKKGERGNRMFSKEAIKLTPKVCEVLKELGWEKWEPEEGEWGLTDYNEAVLIYKNIDKNKKNCPLLANTEYGVTSCIGPEYHEVGIPILHWEKIRKIVEGLYNHDFYKFRIEIMNRAFVEIQDTAFNTQVEERVEDSCQIAVMKAVIELGEIDENKLNTI